MRTPLERLPSLAAAQPPEPPCAFGFAALLDGQRVTCDRPARYRLPLRLAPHSSSCLLWRSKDYIEYGVLPSAEQGGSEDKARLRCPNLRGTT